MINHWLPIKSQSPNVKEHWTKTYRRNKDQRYWIKYLFSLHPQPIPLPCSVELTRTGPRKLDYDNMVYSQKTIRDSIAAHLCNDYIPGHADGDERIQWKYDQKKGKLGVNIKIESIL